MYVVKRPLYLYNKRGMKLIYFAAKLEFEPFMSYTYYVLDGFIHHIGPLQKKKLQVSPLFENFHVMFFFFFLGKTGALNKIKPNISITCSGIWGIQCPLAAAHHWLTMKTRRKEHNKNALSRIEPFLASKTSQSCHVKFIKVDLCNNIAEI